MDKYGLRSLQIISCLAFVAIATSSNCWAQEVGSLDLTKVVMRRDLRRPAGIRQGPAVFADFSCGNNTRKTGMLHTEIESLDRQRYMAGDWLRFEITIKNVGSIPLRIPFSPDLADLQPEDAAQKFGYSALQVSLWAAAGNDTHKVGLNIVRLSGAEDHANTMVTLSPGEWVRIAGRDKIHFPPDQTTVDLIHAGAFDRAYPQVAVYHSETSLTPTSSATDSHEICIQQTRGKGFPITLATEQ
jgi:hypothetical protein